MGKRVRWGKKTTEVSEFVLEDPEDNSLRNFRRSTLAAEFQIMNSLECQDKEFEVD